MSETPDEGWERDDCVRRTIVLPTELAERLSAGGVQLTRNHRSAADPALSPHATVASSVSTSPTPLSTHFISTTRRMSRVATSLPPSHPETTVPAGRLQHSHRRIGTSRSAAAVAGSA